MTDIRVTFGQRFRRDVHPQLPAAHPDGYVVFVTDYPDNVRLLVVDQLGVEWSGIYTEPFADFRDEYYPRGELARFVDGQWIARHVGE